VFVPVQPWVSISGPGRREAVEAEVVGVVGIVGAAVRGADPGGGVIVQRVDWNAPTT